MKRISNYWPLMLLLAAAPAFPAETSAAAPDKEALTQMGLRIQQAAASMRDGNFEEGAKSLDAVIHSEIFQSTPPKLQYATFMLASIAADARRDYLGAHEYLLAATQYEDARAEQWLQRARFASRIDNDADAALALTTVARSWPAEMQKPENNDFPFRLALDVGQNPKLRAESVALSSALFDAKFTLDVGEQPSVLWQRLALEALNHNDLARARQVSARVVATDVLLRMRVDKRYDALVKADPLRFDLADALQRRTRDLRQMVADHPRSLHAIVRLADALNDEGKYAEALAICEPALRKARKSPANAPVYDDIDKALNWLYNTKATSLWGLTRWDDSLAVMEDGRVKLEDGSQNVSQAINLGGMYVRAGQPKKGLATIAGIDWANSLSPYGRMQLQKVRYRAYLQLGSKAEADEVFAWLREHRKDAESSWLAVMLESGDAEGAAALYISQLKDADTRGDALAEAQEYRHSPALPLVEEARKRWDQLFARADVLAAIDEVGRREKVPLFD